LLELNTMAVAPLPARRPMWLWPMTAACALHMVVWWAWAHQGFTGSQAQVSVLEVDQRPSRQQQSDATDLQAHLQPLQVRLSVAQAAPTPPKEAEWHAADVRAVTQALDEASTPDANEVVTPDGPQWMHGHYALAEALDLSPQPESGWFLDDDALASLAHGRMVVRVWVSEQGRIDHAELVRAEPPGEWALQALRPLPGTPMRPGQRDGHAVASTVVVELVSDNERIQ
jgi:hypothetical protein